LDFLGAISRYSLQSFVLNPKTKGFPLLSGLEDGFSEEAEGKNFAFLHIAGLKKTGRRLSGLEICSKNSFKN
jgi:hypothetical protein